MNKNISAPITHARYEVITQEDPETGDIFIPIPPILLEQLDWKEGDELQFDISKEGKMYVKKIG